MDADPPSPPVLGVGGSIGRGLLPTFTTPFSWEIMEAPRSKKVKMPSIESFDGTTDPYNHLDVYKTQMYIQDVDDAICCRHFPTALRGITKKWFNCLPSGSITSFLQLVKLFNTHLVARKRKRKTSIHMAKTRQAKGKDMKEYMMRLNREAVLIPDLQDGVAYAAFLNGLLLGRFKFFLIESKVITLVDALRMAQDFIPAIKICDGDDFIWQDTWKRMGKDNHL